MATSRIWNWSRRYRRSSRRSSINATQPGPFNNMPLWAFSVVPREYGMPYSQLYGQNAEDQRLKRALWARAEIMGQDPIVPGPSRYGYRMMGDYSLNFNAITSIKIILLI